MNKMLLSDADIKDIVTNLANEMYGEDDTEYGDSDAVFYTAFAKAIIAAQDAMKPSKRVKAVHLGYDFLDNGTIVATYYLPVKSLEAPDLYSYSNL